MLAHLDTLGGRRQGRPSKDRRLGRRLEDVSSRDVEFDVPIAATTHDSRFDADNSRAGDGSSVVVWTQGLGSNGREIRARRLDPDGAPVGSEIVVGDDGLDACSPAVAMNDAGRFVVAWIRRHARGFANVVARCFDLEGNPTSGLIQVGVDALEESEPDVAMDGAGHFVVSLTRVTSHGNPDVIVKRYDGAGRLLKVVDVARTTHAEGHSKVAMTPDGRFFVAWEEALGTTARGIRLARYTPAGALIEGNLVSAPYDAARNITPSVAVDDEGNGVVAWERNGNIKARRFHDRSGQEAPITLASTTAHERLPSAAMSRHGGGFVVAREAVSRQTRVRIAEVSAANEVVAIDAGLRSTPEIAMDTRGEYLITSTAMDDLGRLDIRCRRGAAWFDASASDGTRADISAGFL